MTITIKDKNPQINVNEFVANILGLIGYELQQTNTESKTEIIMTFTEHKDTDV